MRTSGLLVSCGRHPVVLRSFSQMARHFKRVCSVWSVKSYTSFLRSYYCGGTAEYALRLSPFCFWDFQSVSWVETLS